MSGVGGLAGFPAPAGASGARHASRAGAPPARDGSEGMVGVFAALLLAAREGAGFGEPAGDRGGAVDGGRSSDPGASLEDAASPETSAAPSLDTGDPRRADPDLEGVAPELQRRLARVMRRMEALGHRVEVVEGMRSQARQDLLWRQGRELPGPRVTWTRSSLHTEGRAVDVQVDGGWTDIRAFAALQRIAAQEGLGTLGMRDPGHLELPPDADHPRLGLRPHPPALPGRGTPSDSGTGADAGAAGPASARPTAGVARPAVAARPARVARPAPVARRGVVPRPGGVVRSDGAPAPASGAGRVPAPAAALPGAGSLTAAASSDLRLSAESGSDIRVEEEGEPQPPKGSTAPVSPSVDRAELVAALAGTPHGRTVEPGAASALEEHRPYSRSGGGDPRTASTRFGSATSGAPTDEPSTAPTADHGRPPSGVDGRSPAASRPVAPAGPAISDLPLGAGTRMHVRGALGREGSGAAPSRSDPGAAAPRGEASARGAVRSTASADAVEVGPSSEVEGAAGSAERSRRESVVEDVDAGARSPSPEEGLGGLSRTGPVREAAGRPVSGPVGPSMAERVAEVRDLQEARPAGSRLHVDVADLDGEGTNLRLRMRGARVETTVEFRDPDRAARARTRVDDLHRSLERAGLEPEAVTLRSGAEGADGRGARDRGQQQAAPDRRFGRPGGGEDPSRRRDQNQGFREEPSTKEES